MKVDVFLNKSIEDNASMYFDESKKAKKKIESIDKVLDDYKKKLNVLLKKEEVEKDKVSDDIIDDRKKEWYEKFRWFFTSEGFLVIGGRDATSNEIIIKKHTEDKDLVFHTDMAGSPFFVIKSKGREVSEASIKETASATACYSKAWKAGMMTASVFYVEPSQVTKEAQSGEYLQKGSFMIRGKTNYVDPNMKIAIGLKDNVVIGGPVESVSHVTDNFVVLVSGTEKSGAIAKLIQKKIGKVNLDEIIKFIPAGGSSIEKKR